MKWTTDQQKVIDLRDKNILVSAAAGSGKTAVLVERIITLITEGEDPIDIDRLLIVTFTNAAAAEMRERIGEAIEEKLNDEPNNLHLQKQIMLVHNAQITTIHSFCLFVIRNYFNTINIDPSFRVGNESELVLLKSDVIEDLLEVYYESEDQGFLHFVESFSTGKTDAAIEDIILKLHNFSMSFPWPEDWLDEKKKEFDIDTTEDMEKSDWIATLKSYIGSLIDDVDSKYGDLISLCKESDGPEAYLEAIYSDLDYLDELKGLTRYEEYYKSFSGFKFKALSRKKQEDVSVDKRELAKNIRNEIKDIIRDITKQYFFQSPEEMVRDIKSMKKDMNVLIDITKGFTYAYNKKKEERNIVDFNDIEHLCLNILVKLEEGEVEYTAAADELASFYEEILIDEYQDSNLVQETILNGISRERYGKPNRFMVGDVKQSIYKFRLARPEIFMDKYEDYESAGDSEVPSDPEVFSGDIKNQRVDLHKNFRSREIVLETVNSIFSQIMTRKIGNITYDDKAALYPGADFGQEGEDISSSTDIIIVSPEKPEKQDLVEEGLIEDVIDEIEDLDERELEAKAIAIKIKELTSKRDGLNILDKETKKYRRVEYKDIVILLRTMRNWADVFVDVLSGEGIPCYAQTQTGYFDTLEIKTILDMLQIIDNPRQDIPFTAVLRCPVVGLNSNELARIRMVDRDCSIYEAAVTFRDKYNGDNKDKSQNGQEEEQETSDQGDNTRLAKSLGEFLNKLEGFRGLVPFLTTNELIIKVLEESGFYDLVSAMPSGEKRQANVDMLIQKAIQFEETSYSGLFHFIRYIEKLHKFDVDFGEADAVSGSDNSVRIMSTHKSKGLEFPVVFVSGLGKGFNQQDSRDKILIHPDLGLGPDFIDPEKRIKIPTLLKKVIQKNIVIENLGEELRVLYVAMTRAKEKLILTGSVKKTQDQFIKWQGSLNQSSQELSFYQISKAKTFLDWIMPAVFRLDSLDIVKQGGIEKLDFKGRIKSPANISLEIVNYEELAVRELVEHIEREEIKDQLENWDYNHIYDEDIRMDIDQLINFEYPYQQETKIHAKLTVTELKRLSQLEEEETGVRLETGPAEKLSRIPDFIQEEGPVKGASLGSIYHKILDDRSILEVQDKGKLRKYLNNLLINANFSEEELKSINEDKLLGFLNSNLADRMRDAQSQNKLFTERQFVMGLSGSEINKKMKSDDLVLIQGIIDVYFEENGELVLLDYKTDRVDPYDGEEILRNRYYVQLDYYKQALEQLTGKKVKEKIIYSFSMNKELSL